MNSFRFYYINLDKSTERKAFMEDQFSKKGLKITRFKATYGKELDPIFLKKTKRKHHILEHYPLPNDGEIGICMTHFNLWKYIAEQPEDYAIVFEDDAKINDDFFTDFEKLLNQISTDEFLDISGKQGYITLEKNELVVKYLVPPVLMIGQIIGKEAAKKLSKNIGSYFAPIDVMKQDVFKHKVPLYSTHKKYVVTNDKKMGGSTIQQNNMHAFKKIIREIFRPFWQLLTLFTYKPYRAIRNYIFYKK